MTVGQMERVGRRPGAAGTGEAPVLWHLEVSPYNEKVRWALDHKRVPHRRRAAVPGPHRKLARKLSDGSTLPVLLLGGEAIGDSTRIVEALERRWPEPPLYPADPDERRHALALEDFFDEQLGPNVRVLLLHHLVPDPALLLGAFAPGLGRRRRFMARAAFPLVRRRVVREFGIDDRSVELAFEQLRVVGRRFRDEVEPSGYLVGHRFTIADLTLASMLAPVVAPAQFPYAQPQREHPRVAPLRDELDRFGLVRWTRRIYSWHRDASAEIGGAR